MVDFRMYLESVIRRGDYHLADMEDRITKMWIEGRITDADREALLPMAAEYADDRLQIDVVAKLADLEHRVYELEHPVSGYTIWYAGYVTQKGEIVRYDVTGDGEYDLCQYNGGRASTSLSIGKIDGWNMLDRELNIIATITRDADGNFVITPIEPEPVEDEEPTE